MNSTIFCFQQQFCIDGVEIFAATFDDSLQIEEVLPAERNSYILAATDELVRRQRYAVWRLLDLALCKKYGKGVAEMQLCRLPSGKWVCTDADVCFSLSHSGRAVAVALSDAPIGVDLQRVSAFANDNRLARRMLDSSELARLESLPEGERKGYLAERWAAGESAFKLTGGDVFLPRCTPAAAHAHCQRLFFGGEEFVLAVAY